MDGKQGFEIVVPTEMTYDETDGSDIRVKRVYVCDPDGAVVKVNLQDEMGVPFSDLPDVRDDLNYFRQLDNGRNGSSRGWEDIVTNWAGKSL